jgi:hypothetical protein
VQNQIIVNSKKTIYFLIVILSICFSNLNIYAATYSITGKIIDNSTNTALTGASIALIDANEKAIKGKYSDKNGFFEIDDVSEGSYKLKISFIGYETILKEIRVKSNLNLKEISLITSSVTTGQIEVVEKMNLGSQKNDTTELNAGAYKVNQNASAEDLVRKMPGVQIESDGTVKAQGETVKKVLVDGKQFFGDDPSIALKNLPSDMIDKVQIYDKASDQAQFTGFDDGNASKTMNIITKPNRKNGYFGKVVLSGADQGLYSSNLTLNVFKGNMRLSVLGMSNNVSQSNFQAEDIMGMMGGGQGQGQRMMQRMMSRFGSAMPRPGGAGGGFMGGMSDYFVSSADGKSKTHSFGINYTDLWAENLQVSSSYFFNFTNTITDQIADRIYYLDTLTNQTYNQSSNFTSDNYNHRFNMEMTWNIDSSNSLMIKPRISFQDNNQTTNSLSSNYTRETNSIEKQLLNKSDNSYKVEGKGYNFSNDLLYRLKLSNNGRTLSFNLNTTINDKKSNTDIYTLNTFKNLDQFYFDTLNQAARTPKISKSWNTNFSYTEPVGDSSQLSFSYDLKNSFNQSDKRTNNYDSLTQTYSNLDTLLSNSFDNQYIVHRPSLNFRTNSGRWSYQAGINYQYTDLKNTQTLPSNFQSNFKFEDFLPSFNLTYKVNEANNLRVMYRTNTNVPSIDQLQKVIDNTNSLQLSTGNPNLKQEYAHNFTLRYNNMNFTSQEMFFMVFNMNFKNNSIANSNFIAISDTVIDDIKLNKGVQLSRPTNLDGYYNLSTFITYGMPVSFLSSNLNTSLGGNFNHTPGLTNNIKTITNSYNASLTFLLGSNISEDVDFTVVSRTNYNFSKSDYQNSNSQSYFIQNSNLKLKYKFFETFFVQGDLNSTIYVGKDAGSNPDVNLLNLSFGTSLFSNNMGELKFGVYDLLKQNKAINRSINDLYIENSQTNVLQQYFMLTFTYNFREFGSISPKMP